MDKKDVIEDCVAYGDYCIVLADDVTDANLSDIYRNQLSQIESTIPPEILSRNTVTLLHATIPHELCAASKRLIDNLTQSTGNLRIGHNGVAVLAWVCHPSDFRSDKRCDNLYPFRGCVGVTEDVYLELKKGPSNE